MYSHIIGLEMDMSDLKAKEYKQFEEIKHIRGDGSRILECSGSWLIALDYTKWENFFKG